MVRNGEISRMQVYLLYRKEKPLENRDFAIIGENIRRLRKENNYTQEFFAEKLQVSAKHVSCIENAETNISLPLLLKIKHFFSVDANELLEPHAGKRTNCQQKKESCRRRKVWRISRHFLQIVQRKKRKSFCVIYGISGRTFGLSKTDTTGTSKAWQSESGTAYLENFISTLQ